MKKGIILSVSLIAAAIAVLIACNKSKNAENNTHLIIRLTDNPYNASEVNVDIRQVRVNFRDDSTGWIDLQTNAGIYNLLDFQNGIDTVIAQGTVPADYLKEIRFVLGSNNSIVIDSTTHPMMVPSGSQSGYKIKIDRLLDVTLNSIVIDFDADSSIVKTGNGMYILRPVLKLN